MYIANKPAKYGLKIFALTDSRTYYTVNREIHTGSQIEGPYAINNNTYAMDKWFTSVEVPKTCLASIN